MIDLSKLRANRTLLAHGESEKEEKKHEISPVQKPKKG